MEGRLRFTYQVIPQGPANGTAQCEVAVSTPKGTEVFRRTLDIADTQAVEAFALAMWEQTGYANAAGDAKAVIASKLAELRGGEVADAGPADADADYAAACAVEVGDPAAYGIDTKETPTRPTLGPIIPLDNWDVPTLPDGVFRYWLGEHMEAVATATETPMELAAGFALGVLAAAVQRRFSVRPEPGYFEPLNLFTMTALPPGSRKSSVMGAIIAPLVDVERELMGEAVEKIKRAESERKTYEGRLSALRAKATRTDSGDEFQALTKEIAELEAAMPDVPGVPRYIADDVTPEHLGTMLANNGERLAIISDEGGMFDIAAGRYNNNLPNLDLYLKAHAGSNVRVDRGSRPPVMLDHPALTIALSPQPEVLNGLAGKAGFRGRGFLARFLYAVPKSNLGYRQLRTAPVPDGIAKRYADGIRALAEIPPRFDNGREIPRALSLSSPAWRVWKDLQREVETMMRPGGRCEHITDWAGKLPGAVARLAGLLHCADYASDVLNNLEIDGDTMGRAIRLGNFYLEHALAVFGQMGADPGHEAAVKMWENIRAERKPAFTARELWMPLRGRYPTMKDIEPGFEVLIEHNLIHEPEAPAGTRRRGKPSRWFRVHPDIEEGGWK